MFDLQETTTMAIPPGFAELAPGRELAVVLAGIDRDSLSDFDRVEVLKARARLRSHLDAEIAADMVGILDAEFREVGDGLEYGIVHDLAAAEIGLALSWTRRASERQLDFASTLVTDYPTVWTELSQGLIDLPRARVICESTIHLDTDVRELVVEQALEKAGNQTTGQLATRIRRLAITVDPDQAKKRYQEGVEERRVISEANPDGTANLAGYQLPADRTQSAMTRLDQTAHQLKAAGDPRSLDQLRADLYLDLLNGTPLPDLPSKGQGRNRGVVDIHADLTTLLDLDQQPGQIPGWGPLIADITRQIIEDQFGAEWRYQVTTPEGNLLTGTTRKRPDKTKRRKPTAAQKRQVQTENPECVWPTCLIGSIQCDIDHNHPWIDHGPTQVDNLAPLCRHHHVIRHNGWTITQIQPGEFEITSPLGHTYTTTRSRGP